MPVSFCVRTPISALRKGRNSPAITAFTRLDLGALTHNEPRQTYAEAP